MTFSKTAFVFLALLAVAAALPVVENDDRSDETEATVNELSDNVQAQAPAEATTDHDPDVNTDLQTETDAKGGGGSRRRRRRRRWFSRRRRFPREISLTSAQQLKVQAEIVFDGNDKWTVYDCNWANGEPGASHYKSISKPDPGFKAVHHESECTRLGDIECPCGELLAVWNQRATWPKFVEDKVAAQVAALNMPASTGLALAVKKEKERLISGHMSRCIQSHCARCLVTNLTDAQGASCQKNWTYYNAYITELRSHDGSKCSYWAHPYRTHNTWDYRESPGWCCSQYGAHMGHVWTTTCENCGHGSTTVPHVTCPSTGEEAINALELSNTQGADTTQKTDDLLSLMADEAMHSSSDKAGWACW